MTTAIMTGAETAGISEIPTGILTGDTAAVSGKGKRYFNVQYNAA